MYISLNEFMKKYNVGHDVALKMLYSGNYKYIKTNGGRYKILVSDEPTFISIEEYNKVVRENEKLKTIIKNISNISKEALNE